MANNLNSKSVISQELKNKIRVYYITTNCSLQEASSKFNVPLTTVKHWCTRENWAVFKRTGITKIEVSEEIYKEICTSIGFYSKVKEDLSNLYDSAQGVKEKKDVVDCYKIAETRLLELMIYEEEE